MEYVQYQFEIIDVVYSLLEDLQGWLDLLWFYHRGTTDHSDPIQILEVELKLLRLFLTYIANWSDANELCSVDQELASLILDLEVVFKETRAYYKVAAENPGSETNKDYPKSAISELQNKLKVMRPQVRAAYEYIASNSSFPSSHPLSNWDKWTNFIEYLCNVVWQQCELLSHFSLYLHIMHNMLRHLHWFISEMDCRYFDRGRYLFSHFGAVLVSAAHFCYLCWIHLMDEDKNQELIIMLAGLLKALKPNTLQVTKLCLELIAFCYSGSYDYRLTTFVEFLIPERKFGLEVCKRLEGLIKFYTEASDLKDKDDETKLLLMEITAAISELGSFGYSFYARKGRSHLNPSLFRWLEKIELLKADLFLIKLLQHRISLKFLEAEIDSFQNELIYLQSYHRDASEGESKAPTLIWLQIIPIAREAGSIYRSLYAMLDDLRRLEDTPYPPYLFPWRFSNTTQQKFRNKLLKLLEKNKLLKAEIVLEEIMYGHPSLIVNVKDQMESLDQGVIVLRTYLIGPLNENEKLILTHAESVARDAARFCYSLLGSEITVDMVRQFRNWLPELVEKMKLVNAEIKESYKTIRSSTKSHLSKVEGFGFIDFLLGDMKGLLNSEADSLVLVKHQIHIVHGEIKFFKSFLRSIEEQFNEHQDLKSLVLCIVHVILEAEYLIESFRLGDCLRWFHPLWLSDLVEDLSLIKVQATEIYKNAHRVSTHDLPRSPMKDIAPAKIPQIDEVVVGLADQKRLIIDRLIAGSSQLDVVSIIGMAGLGKTTLAWKVYNDPSVTYHFHIRAWCCISQAYHKGELLLQILGDIMEITEEILEMSNEDLELKLYRCLKGKRYLIVMDDIWSIEAWYDFKRSFPNDNNGSRVLITSRHFDVAEKIKAYSSPHLLRPLSDDESWKLLQKKLYDTKECPDELLEVGKQIAISCKGLPLAVVAIAGLLKRSNMTPDKWKQVSESMCSRIADDPETRCMDILELSYNYLPNYLKPCFLYIAVFLKDKDIPVRKLAWLWRAEGFITDNRVESVEDTAERYLRDLIGRSLVMPSKRRSNGGVKTCQSQEENFLQFQNGYDELFDSSHEDIDYGVDPNHIYPKTSIKYQKSRLSICSKRNHFIMSRPYGPYVHSLLYSATSDSYPRCPYDISFIFDNFKLLGVLDLECINMGNSFPTGVLVLAGLRFLALCGDVDSIPDSISHLRDLETLIVKGLKGTENIMRRLLKLQKLRCLFSELRDDTGKCNQFPILKFLTELDSLNILYSGRIAPPCKFDLPLNLRKLTLSKFRLPWNCISEIGRLPNLEVLKLLSKAFEGKVWEMKEGEFLKLKFLKLDTLSIAEWKSSSDHLPQLQHLILRNCRQLKEVPSGFGDSSSLEMIEVQLCTRSVEESVRLLQKEQHEMGNELKVLVDRSDMDFNHLPNFCWLCGKEK
nr:putative late blight resistance protein homolog R1A-4 isoform X1 [Coffea arabica]